MLLMRLTFAYCRIRGPDQYILIRGVIVRAFACAQDAQSFMQFRRLRPENERFEMFVVRSYFVVLRVLTCNRLLYV